MGRFSQITSFCKLMRYNKNMRFFKSQTSTVSDGRNSLGIGFHMIHTQTLMNANVSPKEPVEKEENCAIEDPVPHDVLMERLLKCSSVADQMRTLMDTLQLSAEDKELRHSVAKSIKDLLSPFFQDFDVKLFGSTANSYGFKGCDIDMVFYTNNDPNNLKKTVFDDSDIPTPEDVLAGKFSREYMDLMSSRDQLLFIHTALLDYYKESVTAPIFINSYVPLIRLLHDRYQLKIDLTPQNRYGIYNSKLLHVYSQLDDRVLPLLGTIRYWGKHTGIVGRGMMFNTYCLTLLGIYFLQTRNPPVLPAVEQIISLTDQLVTTEMSEENYQKILQVLPPSKNTETPEELLREFFFYYFYFDFAQVVCPLSARCMSRSDFFNIGKESKRFRFNTICVQDPFRLTHNVANLVDYKHCKLFARTMLSLCKFFQDHTKWTSQSGSWGIAAMMEVPPAERDTIVEMSIPLRSKDQNGIAPLLNTAKIVSTIFEKCLLFNVQRFEEVNNVLDLQEGDAKLLFSCKCDGNVNTWLGRNSVQIDELSVEDTTDVYAVERAISLKLCQRDKIEERDCSSSFYCKFYVTKENGKFSLILKLDFIKNQSSNTILGIFLKEYLPKILPRFS